MFCWSRLGLFHGATGLDVHAHRLPEWPRSVIITARGRWAERLRRTSVPAGRGRRRGQPRPARSKRAERHGAAGVVVRASLVGGGERAAACALGFGPRGRRPVPAVEVKEAWVDWAAGGGRAAAAAALRQPVGADGAVEGGRRPRLVSAP